MDKLEKIRDYVKKKEKFVFFLASIVLGVIFILLLLIIMILFLTVEWKSIIFFGIGLVPPVLLTVGICVFAVYFFVKSSKSYYWLFMAFSCGGVAVIPTFIILLIIMTILALAFIMFNPTYAFAQSFLGILYGLCNGVGTFKMSGFELALSATIISAVGSLLEVGLSFLFFAFFFFLTKDEYSQKLTNLFVSSMFSMGFVTISSLLWMYIYETFYGGYCTFCLTFPFPESHKWGINISLILSKMVYRVIVVGCNGVAIGVFWNFYAAMKSWMFLVAGACVAFVFSFFYDFISLGFNGRLTYGGWFGVILFQCILLGIAILAVVFTVMLMIYFLKFFKIDKREMKQSLTRDLKNQSQQQPLFLESEKETSLNQ